MAKKTTIDKMDKAIRDILNEYTDSVQENLDIITKQMGQKGAEALRQESKTKLKQHTGEYAKGWKHEFRQVKRYSKTTIFNDHYSLPHLLEFGHVTRNGTSRVSMNMMKPTPPHEHIKPIADDLTRTYERELKSKL